MILHAIDYNGGQIWVHKQVKLISGDTFYNPELKMLDRYLHGTLYQWGDKLIAQSPNLSLPNIPYVEVEEDYFLSKIQPDFDTKESYQHGFHDAIQVVKDHYSAKKYTEEDLEKAIDMARQGVFTKISDGQTDKEWDYTETEIIQCLQPKVVSIEVEMEVGEVHYGSNVKHPCKLRTYIKDGKTFLKVKSVNYRS